MAACRLRGGGVRAAYSRLTLLYGTRYVVSAGVRRGRSTALRHARHRGVAAGQPAGQHRWGGSEGMGAMGRIGGRGSGHGGRASRVGGGRGAHGAEGCWADCGAVQVGQRGHEARGGRGRGDTASGLWTQASRAPLTSLLVNGSPCIGAHAPPLLLTHRHGLPSRRADAFFNSTRTASAA